MSTDLDLYDDFPSGEYFFKAVDVGSKRIALTIVRVESRVMGDSVRPKPVLFFKEDERGLPLNGVNKDELRARFGRKASDLIGKRVTILTRQVQGPHGPCLGIRFADVPTAELIGDDLPANMKTPAKKKRGGGFA